MCTRTNLWHCAYENCQQSCLKVGKKTHCFRIDAFNDLLARTQLPKSTGIDCFSLGQQIPFTLNTINIAKQYTTTICTSIKWRPWSTTTGYCFTIEATPAAAAAQHTTHRCTSAQTHTPTFALDQISCQCLLLTDVCSLVIRCHQVNTHTHTYFRASPLPSEQMTPSFSVSKTVCYLSLCPNFSFLLLVRGVIAEQ